MGLQAYLQQAFPPSQSKALLAALRGEGFRRRIDQSLTAVTLATNTTTTMATLRCPPEELLPGSVMHFQIAGTITNSGSSALATPALLLNGTEIWKDAATIASNVDTARSYLIDARIIWSTPAVVLLTGSIMIAPDLAIAATGTGSLEVNAADATETIVTPIYHTLSSQVMGREQIITATMLFGNGPTGTVNAATLWVE